MCVSVCLSKCACACIWISMSSTEFIVSWHCLSRAALSLLKPYICLFGFPFHKF